MCSDGEIQLVGGEILMGVRDKWKCATMECGGQYVLMDGIKLLLILCVVNSDTQTIVSLVH